MAGGTWRKLRITALRRKSYDPGQVEDTLLRRKAVDITTKMTQENTGRNHLVKLNLNSTAGARIPKAGAAYNYTYVALGEIVAFLIGWCNILECVFGSASVAKGLSMHLDDIFNTSMTDWFATVAPILVPFMSPYFDFFAFLVVIIMGADSSNWSIPLEEVPADHGKGGFFPFGVWGTLRGAAVCFYGFVGFDSVCAAGEEVRAPRRVIPITIVVVILVTLLCYASVATVVTMMVPYYLQYFSKLTESRQSPMIATMVPTIFIATLAGLFEVEMLVATMCIGTLFTYTAVASSVIIMSSVLHAIALILVLIMAVQPQTKEELPFKTPLVPLMPCLSIYFNIHLMVIISGVTWIRVGIWIAFGIIIYLMKFCFCKREKSNLKENMTIIHASENGKAPVQIKVESPTPPDTIARTSNYGGDTIQEEDEIQEDIQESIVRSTVPIKKEETMLHQAYIENNEEKEAKIIDLLDQVLQAEEDTYGELISLKEVKEEEEVVSTSQETAVHRKSLSELSDAGSDASLGSTGLSKYDVIAQVHREDLPRVNEEEEKSEREDTIYYEDENDELVTAFNDSDSRTDESGYSDTIDRNALSESLEESKEDIPNIPVPPPLPDILFLSPNFRKSYTIASKHSNPPPPLEDDDDENRPRESITSNSTLGEDNMTFGSDRQVNFMSKLNNIFQTKITTSDDEEPRKRSHSTGNVVENTEFSTIHQRPAMFMALQNEITSKEAAQNLRPVNAEEKPELEHEEEEEEDVSLTRQDLKSKLEGIFAAGGPQLLKPRLMKSNPPTPEDSYQTDTSSTESIPKLPKMDKNDTLKRQKDKFSAVLNSFRLSFKDDDDVV
ncbi:High affinity cationic amino acid transporter 1 [Operophtera brumata]|uniref:High affinity cationic amino acid transporter 1 n=1 Tax=Operophtera brumata TaxID=104452 RepID=A0A0L7KYN5_OPEBR|nr:High affinity cationic amino acid transporter 1 [Operophtera brumata]